MAAAAEAAGESVRTAYKWLARLRAGGERMLHVLHDRSSAPGRTPHATPAAAIEAVEALRRERMSGPAIARELGLPRVAIGRPPAQVARITLTQFWHGAAGSGVKVPPAKAATRRHRAHPDHRRGMQAPRRVPSVDPGPAGQAEQSPDDFLQFTKYLWRRTNVPLFSKNITCLYA